MLKEFYALYNFPKNKLEEFGFGMILFGMSCCLPYLKKYVGPQTSIWIFSPKNSALVGDPFLCDDCNDLGT